MEKVSFYLKNCIPVNSHREAGKWPIADELIASSLVILAAVVCQKETVQNQLLIGSPVWTRTGMCATGKILCLLID